MPPKSKLVDILGKEYMSSITRIVPGGVFVNFYGDVSDETVDEYLESLALSGVRMSAIVNRYAIDVPPGEEPKYLKIFADKTDLVERVFPDYVKGFRIIKKYKDTKPRSDFFNGKKRF